MDLGLARSVPEWRTWHDRGTSLLFDDLGLNLIPVNSPAVVARVLLKRVVRS